MITEHTAIFKLYPNVVTVRDSGKDDYICKDKDGNLVSVDVSAINAEFANLEYI